MSRSVRPGSLTFLAVLNFVGAGFGLLFGVLGTLILLLVTMGPRAGAGTAEGLPPLPTWYLGAGLAVSLLTVALLLLSGIGYLRQRPLLGRWCGNGYALLSLGWSVLEVTAFTEAHGQRDIGLMTLIGMVYPLITVLWLNLILADVWRGVRLGGAAADDMAQPPAAPAPPAPYRFLTHLRLNAAQSLRQTLRGTSGLLICLVLVISGLSTVQVVGMLVEFTGLESMTAQSLDHWIGAPGRPAWLADFQGARWARHLVLEHPPSMSLSWLALALMLPLLATLGSFNLIAADAQHRGFRFLLLRTDRASIYFGRFLGSVALIGGILALLVVCIDLVLVPTGRAGSAPQALGWSAWGFLVMMLASLPWLALGQWFSTLVPSGFGALALAGAVTAVVPGVAMVLASRWDPLWHAVPFMPYGIQVLLLHPHPGLVAAAVLGSLAYTALFLALGYRHFAGRDL